MLLVGIGRGNHDCSVSAIINGEFKYAKYERDSGLKYGNAPEGWFWKRLINWGIDPEAIDCLVETDGGHFNHNHGSPRLPHNGELFMRRKKQEKEQYLIDHHFAHALSWVGPTIPDQFVVIDGNGSAGNTGLLMTEEMQRRRTYVSVGSVFNQMHCCVTGDMSYTESAGKIMGLIPYGEPNPSVVNVLKCQSPDIAHITMEYLELVANGRDSLDRDPEIWEAIASINEACYHVIRTDYFEHVDKSKPVIYSGGCAMNVDWNRRLLDEGYDVWVPPPANDAGLSIGALRLATQIMDVEFPEIPNYPYVEDDEKPRDVPSQKTIKAVAEKLARGQIVGWYQGNGEIGSRALGNRSILMRPDLVDGKDTLNQKVKHREWWRPFGASVKKENAAEFFDLDENPHMLFTSKVLVDGLHSITHVDDTCRHQTVTPEQNESYYLLLDEFHKLTGLPLLLNTSLNLGGNPIAGRIEEAFEVLQTTEMDALCVGDELHV